MKLGYRPALDGLRGVAILAVLGFHAFHWPGQGWLGVDLFFVLSGFLITTLLLEEHAENGRVSLPAFYVRRARRLVPAMVALLIVFAVVVAAGRGLGKDEILGLGASGAYLMDLVLGLHFPTAAAPAELTPLWSLALEEQFYLVWPAVLFLVLGGRRRAGAILALVATVLFTVRMIVLHGGHAADHRLLFSPDTRAVGLAVGCLAAFLLVARPRVPARLGLAGPVCMVLAAALAVSIDTYFNGTLTVFVLLVGVAIVAALEADSLFARALSVQPLAYVGRISYSLYLWHLPVLLAFGAVVYQHPSSLRKAVALATAFAAAVASYHLVEQRFRRARRPTVAPQPTQDLAGREPASWEVGARG